LSMPTTVFCQVI